VEGKNFETSSGVDPMGFFDDDDEEESVGWGTLPDEYDPAKDESHPMHGFKPDTTDDSF